MSLTAWLSGKVAGWLWRYQREMVANVSAAQLTDQNKQEERRELARELTTLEARSYCRATYAIEAERRLCAGTNSAFNSAGAFHGGGRSERIAQIKNRTLTLTELRSSLMKIGSTRSLQADTSADDLNERLGRLATTTAQIDLLADEIAQELRDDH